MATLWEIALYGPAILALVAFVGLIVWLMARALVGKRFNYD
jgi:ABC-type Fe3+-siderophore transport system permease subunit